jgi:N-methylhydantoinase A
MSYRVAVDIGGTFTDFCMLDEATGALSTVKVLSTPDTPGSEVVTGIGELERRHGIPAQAISYFTHGTTVGVNTVIQRKGAPLALFVTEGFEDVLVLARLKMPDPYDLFSKRPEPLASRERVFGIRERTLADGTRESEVDAESVRRATRAAREAGAEAIVVALLHAYANPENERRVREIVGETVPELSVTLSSDVWPVIREYERTVTATVAGYVQPRVARYIDALTAGLKSAGVAPEPLITKSNGGVMRAELGKTRAIDMLLSGTASGAIGASHIAALTGERDVLSFDVGGTSADVAIIRNGAPQYGIGELVGEFPIYIPTVSVTSIGEGGGSIAWIDALGVLKVGPESAGSQPGPAAYGRGGTRPTVTDAFAVLGFLGEGSLGYGAVSLDLEAARRALTTVAEPLGLSLEAAAEAIVKVSISGMFLEISKLMSRHGADPRDFTLLAFGGAGPMTAAFFAREIGIGRILVPPTPGVLSAFGGLIADVRSDFIRTVLVDLDERGVASLRPVIDDLERTALSWIKEEQRFPATPLLVYTADMRYRGQSYEIEVPIERGFIDAGDVSALARAFHQEHVRVYDHADEAAPAQIVNLRAVVSGTTPKPRTVREEPVEGAPETVGRSRIFLDGGWHQAVHYRRADLKPGHRFTGPAIVFQDDTTTCVTTGLEARVDAFGNLMLTSEA